MYLYKVYFWVFQKNDFFGKKWQNFFRGKHPKYNEFITIGEFPKDSSIDSSFQSKKKKIDGETLYMDSYQKIFSTEILKNA